MLSRKSKTFCFWCKNLPGAKSSNQILTYNIYRTFWKCVSRQGLSSECRKLQWIEALRATWCWNQRRSETWLDESKSLKGPRCQRPFWMPQCSLTKLFNTMFVIHYYPESWYHSIALLVHRKVTRSTHCYCHWILPSSGGTYCRTAIGTYSLKWKSKISDVMKLNKRKITGYCFHMSRLFGFNKLRTYFDNAYATSPQMFLEFH